MHFNGSSINSIIKPSLVRAGGNQPNGFFPFSNYEKPRKDQTIATDKMKALNDCLLYAFVDTAYLHDREPEAIANALCDGGADLIQLRAKQSSPVEIRRLAESILPVLRDAKVGLVINDYPDIAREVGADFCHLGQEDFFEAGYTHTSQVTPQPDSRAAALEWDQSSGLCPLRIGLSTHSPDQAARAVAAQPAYIAIGPVYATGTKPSARPVTLNYVRWAAANVFVPWFAIGGINLENLDEVLASGARRICVVSAILNSAAPAAACRRFKKRLT